MFLIDNNKAGSDWEGVVRHVREILEKRGAKPLSTEKWGERKLAYKINGHKRSTYMLVYFDAPPGALSAIRRDCQLSDTIIRSLILKVEKIPTPTAEAAPPREEKSEEAARGVEA